jgi:hypothetical protein
MNDQASADQLSLIAKQLRAMTENLISISQTLKEIERKLPSKTPGNLS